MLSTRSPRHATRCCMPCVAKLLVSVLGHDEPARRLWVPGPWESGVALDLRCAERPQLSKWRGDAANTMHAEHPFLSSTGCTACARRASTGAAHVPVRRASLRLPAVAKRANVGRGIAEVYLEAHAPRSQVHSRPRVCVITRRTRVLFPHGSAEAWQF